jgi:hypothetical protein
MLKLPREVPATASMSCGFAPDSAESFMLTEETRASVEATASQW